MGGEDIFIVDVPNPHDLGGPWVEVATFRTKEEAEKFCEETFGAFDGGKIQLISRVED